VRKTTPLYSRFYTKNAIILPRQAQDTHRESTQNTSRFVHTKVVVEKFKEAGRPITLGFITYKPPDLQEYDQVRHNPTQPDKTIK
jgi:hypothetical protein